MAMKRCEERLAFSGAVGGTTDAPVVEGVLLCGPSSVNRRRYLRKAFEGEKVKVYNGVPVFLNHGKGPDGRPYQEQIGTIANARHRPEDGMPVGDIAVNPKKPFAEAFLWDATHSPRACGMSHVADCELTRAADGWDEISAIVKVESVDVIAAGSAATTRGLFENRNRSSAVPLTVKALCESLVKHPKTTSAAAVPLKKLAEMDGMDGAMTMVDEPPADDAEPADHVKEAFKAAILHLIDECMDAGEDPKECLQKIKAMLKSHADINGGGGDTETDDEDEEHEESMKTKPSVGTVLAECTAAGFQPAPTDIQSLSLMTDATDRAAFIAAKTIEAGRAPTQPSRRPGAGAAGKPAPTPPTTQPLTEQRFFPEWVA